MSAPVAAPLLATKLYLPVPRATAVARPRLLARALASLRTRLTLIAAPAGFGKSTLLAQALAEGQRAGPQPLQVAWVALDAGDNDPTRFWSYVCAALDRASPGLGAPALAVLHAAPGAAEPALAELLNALTAHPEDVALVLDDYHAITNPAIHQGIGFLLDHAPPQLHLVIASRVDPPLPLARWRARGELAEIRAAELRFTTGEATQFFADTMGLRLGAEEAAALEARTEGWAAGLQLAALSLQGQADVRGFIETFSGSHRHVVDYLAEEVLNRQPANIRAFLLQTSILERMCGELCDQLSDFGFVGGEIQNAQEMLEYLERMNLFLVPLDAERRWYRYHHLFADLLRHRLAHEHPALVAELHRRAARWFEYQGAAAEAVSHALAAGDTDLVVRLLLAHGARFASTGETQTLQRWLDALPRERLLGSPRLGLVQAQVLMLNRQMAAVEPYVQAAAAALGGEEGPEAVALQGELLSMRAHMAIERGAYAEALELAREALALLPAEERWTRSHSALVLGYALYVLGQTSEAVAVHAENVGRCRAASNAVSALFCATEVVKLRVLQGRLAEARAYVEQALAWAAAEGWQQLPPASALHIWRGNVLIEQGDLAGAGDELARAIQLTRAGPAITAARAHAFLARLRQLQGDRAGAVAALAAVEEICRGWGSGGERSYFAAYTARVRLLQGDVDAARRWAAGRPPWDPGEAPSYFRELELLTIARLAALHSSQPGGAGLEEALALLGWLREQAAAAGRGAVVIETLALESIALARGGMVARAQERLDAALAHAAPEGFIGLFAELGAPMADLLAQNRTRRAAGDPLLPYLARLLGAFAAGQPGHAPPAGPLPPVRQGAPEPLPPFEQPLAPPPPEQLTEREREVLRLFAAGMTSQEIAQHFVVSINTVKTQLKSIYSKLDAHSRSEAVARARALGLLP